MITALKFKMNRLFIFVIFAAFLHASLGDTLNYQIQNDLFNFNDTCTAPGLMCQSCSELVQCVEVSPGSFETIILETCETAKNFTCLNQQCSDEPNPRCNNQEVPDFKCMNTGVFPDPYDCKKYHMCSKKEDMITATKDVQIDLKCSDNYGYDPVTTYCKTVLTNGVCPKDPPIPVCHTAGQSGAVTVTSIYYICLFEKDVLIPRLYMCPHGKKYVGFKCV